jgi:starch-binding outer membrane protein, SusD/RagB family
LQKENSEVIMSRFFLQRIGYAWNGYNPGLHNGPNGYHNWGGNTPLQQLVDDYEMADGTYFSWDNPEHAAAPYQNRDPRFYASILYDGAEWRERPSDVIDLDPVGVIQTGRYEQLDENGNVVVVPGLDTRQGPVEDWNGSYTGYYLRKFIDPNIDAQFFRQEVPWPFLRYAEILLNYAEASMMLGQEGEARTYINVIRRRAGMPETNESGDALVKRLQNERRIELAFEEARYFDVRRWMIAPEELSVPGMGIDIYAELNDDGTHTYSYEPVQIQDRGWKDRMYFLPIPEYEIDKNELLVQNPHY